MSIIIKQINPLITFLFIAILFVILSCKSEPITTINSFDGVRLSFDNKGTGDITLILVHGWSNTRIIWDDQISHFSEKYKVIAVDLPGFGKSGNNRSEWTIESYGEDISSIIQQLNLKKAVLVGFSLGAPIVIEAANKMPDQVIGVILVDALQDVEMKIPAPMAQFIDSTMMDLVNNYTKEKLIEGGYFKKNVDSAFQRVVAFLEGASHVGWRESLANLIRWQNENCTNSIKTIKAPIIAINSDQQPTKVEAFRRYVPAFKAKIVQDVGHLIMWDNPAAFNRLLEESIKEFIEE
jgi:pimeloyl-ACP methyl ester carboxylesterase